MTAATEPFDDDAIAANGDGSAAAPGAAAS